MGKRWWGMSLLLAGLLACGVTVVAGQPAQLINGNRTHQGATNYGVTTGTAAAYVLTLDRPITAYIPGSCYLFQAHVPNAAAPTLTVNTVGALPLMQVKSGTLQALTASTFIAGQVVMACYDGTQMQVPSVSSGGEVASPTAAVGLAVVPGTATTAMRSDAAPALSPAITPTWTGIHRFAAVPQPAADMAVDVGMPTARWQNVYTTAVRSEASHLVLGTTGSSNILLEQAGSVVVGPGDGGTPISRTLRGPAAGGTNIPAGTVRLQASLGTGTGPVGYLPLLAGALGTASGAAPHTPVVRHTVGTTRLLTDNTAVSIVSAALAPNTVHGSLYAYVVEVFDGTDLQVEEGTVSCRATNKAGTITNNVCRKNNGDADANHQSTTAGTLTVTFAISAANPAVISVNADSSLLPSSGYPRMTYEAMNLSQQSFTPQ